LETRKKSKERVEKHIRLVSGKREQRGKKSERWRVRQTGQTDRDEAKLRAECDTETNDVEAESLPPGRRYRSTEHTNEGEHDTPREKEKRNKDESARI